jgi:hypothetical protein
MVTKTQYKYCLSANPPTLRLLGSNNRNYFEYGPDIHAKIVKNYIKYSEQYWLKVKTRQLAYLLNKQMKKQEKNEKIKDNIHIKIAKTPIDDSLPENDIVKIHKSLVNTYEKPTINVKKSGNFWTSCVKYFG